MKKILLTILILIFLIPQVTFGFLGDGLQGCWDLEEASGTRIDQTANGNDLTDNNTVTSAVGVIGDGADHERDTNEFLDISDASQTGLNLGTGDFTISVWIKKESIGIFGGLVTKITANDSDGYRIVQDSSNKFGFFVAQTGGSGSTNITTTNTFTSTAVFYNVISVMSGNNMEIFVDNVSEGTGSKSSDYTISTTQRFATGRYRSESNANYTDGIIDIVAVWNRAVTSGERATIFNSGSGTSCATMVADVEVAEVPVSDLWVDFSMIWESIKNLWNKLT